MATGWHVGRTRSPACRSWSCTTIGRRSGRRAHGGALGADRRAPRGRARGVAGRRRPRTRSGTATSSRIPRWSSRSAAWRAAMTARTADAEERAELWPPGRRRLRADTRRTSGARRREIPLVDLRAARADRTSPPARRCISAARPRIAWRYGVRRRPRRRRGRLSGAARDRRAAATSSSPPRSPTSPTRCTSCARTCAGSAACWPRTRRCSTRRSPRRSGAGTASSAASSATVRDIEVRVRVAERALRGGCPSRAREDVGCRRGRSACRLVDDEVVAHRLAHARFVELQRAAARGRASRRARPSSSPMPPLHPARGRAGADCARRPPRR